MQIHLVSGFLGSGKTTAIRTACETLTNKNYRVGVITNDQGIRLVDSGYFANLSIPNRQVIDGCFCCNYNALDNNIQSLIEANNPHVVFAESVGSCTDIVATVMKPLQLYRSNMTVTVSTFADALLLKMLCVDGKPLFGNEVNYIYQKQLEEAGIIVVTKVDLITENELTAIQAFLKEQYAHKTIVYVNGTNADSISNWLAILQQQSGKTNALSSLQIEYDTYGAGEAMLAWLDEELELYSSNETAWEDATVLTAKLYHKIKEHQFAIGHLKFLIDGVHKISYTSTSEIQTSVELKRSSSSQLLMNARIQTAPQFLEKLISSVIKETEEERDCKIIVNSLSAFQPKYPNPTHRIAN